jgi:hypothetical protein
MTQAPPSYPEWLQYRSASPITATHWAFVPSSTAGYGPISGTLKGSANGTDWTDLDAQDVSTKTFSMFAIPAGSVGAYLYHRLHIASGGATLCYVYDLQLYSSPDPDYPDAGNVRDTDTVNGTTGALLSTKLLKSNATGSGAGSYNDDNLANGSVAFGITYGLSGTGSLVAESHGSNDIVSTSGGAWDVGTLSGTTVKSGVTFGLGEVGSYAGAGTTAQAATPSFSIAATGDNLTWTITGTAAGETDPVLQLRSGTSIIAASIQSGQRIRNLTNAGTYTAYALASGKAISEASVAAVAPTLGVNRSAGSLGILYGSSDVVDGTTTTGVAAGTTIAEAGTGYNFDIVFSATDAMFSKTGTLTQAGNGYVFSGIFEEIAGAIETSEGVLIPDGACVVHITKTRIVATPARGDVIYDGARTYDVISPPTEDPSRKGWIITTKRRY